MLNSRHSGKGLLSPIINGNFIAILVMAIAVLFISWTNISITLNEKNYHEEHRSLYVYAPRQAIEKDYVGELLSSLKHPPLYEFVIWASQLSNASLPEIHKVFNIILALLLIFALARIGYLISGGFGAAGVVLLGLTQTIYFYQINSSTEHAFAFPLLAWAGYALYAQKYYLHAVLALLAGLLYPPAGILLGASLTTHLLLDCWRARSLRVHPYKGGIYLLVGLVSIFFLYMQMQPLDSFGNTLTPGEQPEYTPQGRIHLSVYSPLLYIFSKAFSNFIGNLPDQVIFAMLAIEYALFVVGLLYFLRTEKGKYYVLGLTVSSILIFLLFYLVKPGLSYRFFIYPVYTVYPVYIFMGIYGLVTSNFKVSKNIKNMIVVMCLLIFTMVHDFGNAKKLGYEFQLTKSGYDLINFFKKKQGDYLIASWPLEHQADLIPYLTGQPQFVSGKGHIAIYEDYVLRSRERVSDFIHAYFAKKISPVVLLNCKYDINYLIVNRFHFLSVDTVPLYFSPFDKLIGQLIEGKYPEGYQIPAIDPKFVVFQSGEYFVIDLDKLASIHHCESQYMSLAK